MVIVGSHGVGGIKRFFSESTCDYLLHHLNIPVLVVKDPKFEKVFSVWNDSDV